MSRSAAGLVLIAALLISGCSVLGFVYNRADHFALREIERYLPLRPEQREATAAALAELHARHRREQLPLIAAALRRFADAVAQPLSVEDWEGWLQQLEALINDSLAPLPAQAAPLIATLDDAQLQDFWDRLAKEREQRRDQRETLSPGKRAKAVERSLRRWIGRLSPAQQARISAWAEARGPAEEDPAYRAHLAERERALRGLLASRREADFAARLSAFIESDTVPASTRQRWQTEREAMLGLLSSLSAGLSPRQRERAQARLRAYAEVIETLAAGA